MNLGLQLILGGLRKRPFVPGVEGEGTQIAFPSDYYGPQDVNVTGLVVDDITVFETPDTVPKSIQLSVGGHIRASGTHLFNSNPIVPELDCDIRWLLTDENDNPLEDLEGVVDPFSGASVNPYTDQIGFEFSAIGRLPQTYKAKVFVRGKNGGFARVATFEKLIGPVSDNALPERWVDGVSGVDTNDGFSPFKWTGTATYTNATKRIFATGMFTSYDHAAATAGNYTNRYNVGYITGATEAGVPIGQFKIAAKISNDEIELVDALGADYTGLTFSTGPKLTATVTNNTRHRLRGGSAYATDPYKAILPGELDVISYDGIATIQRTGTGSYVVDYRASSSTEVGGLNRFIASNIVVDGQWVNIACGGANTSAKTEVANHVSLWDRYTLSRTDQGIGMVMDFSGINGELHKQTIHWQAGGFDHRYLDSGAVSRGGGTLMKFNEGARWRFIGIETKADGDDNVRHHHLYHTGDNTHAHAAWIKFGAGTDLNYAVNTNFVKNNGIDTKYISYVNNYITEGARRGYDASKINQGVADQWGDIMLIARNKCNAQFGLFQYASMKRARLSDNEVWSASGTSNSTVVSRYFGWDLGPSPKYQLFSNDNKVYGMVFGYSTDAASELYQYDDSVYNEADISILNFHSDLTKISVNNTNLYAPNRVSGNIATIGGVGQTITQLNSTVGTNNTSVDPGWVNPANGNFSTTNPDTYFTDFSTDTIGAQPANTTLKRNSVVGDYQIIDEAGSNVLRFDSTGTANARGLAFNALDSSGVTEIFARGKDSDTNPASLRMVAFASDGPDNEYGVQLSSLNDNVVIYKRVAGTFTQLSTNTVVQGTASYRNILLRITPGSPNTIQVKVWVGDRVTDEPASWLASPTDSELTLTAGWIGTVGFDNALPAFYECFGIGVNGDPAPRS